MRVCALVRARVYVQLLPCSGAGGGGEKSVQ